MNCAAAPCWVIWAYMTISEMCHMTNAATALTCLITCDLLPLLHHHAMVVLPQMFPCKTLCGIMLWQQRQHCHLLAWVQCMHVYYVLALACCSSGMPVHMTALFEQRSDLAHHACLHACCAPALLHDGTCRRICTPFVSSAIR